ncbi:Sporulation related domain-containing protein [Lentibacillus halodurans]|uniref:Sporulation related domain-containing protein n=1 Tax=Lentibacillus halodurans TaxID=237679 RepID=A0A1I0UXX5_9BACI|nr:SPOR domain-containing protein [Lentibacillus halodurans]SFA68905.1 Sporulation related domain-containing protein [Lentibacillus halodurans]
MGKGKKIVVWMNGTKTKLTRYDEAPDEQYSIKEFNKEQAAAVEDSDIPELIRQDSDEPDSEVYFTRKSRFRAFKPFLIAALSAIVIGSVLGFFMLNMFVDINDDIGRQGDAPPLAAAGDEDGDEGSSNSDKGDNAGSGSDDAASSAAIDAVNVFVLQAGKFGEQANADEMAATFQESGYPAMVWEKGEFFFVLSGITDSKQQAAQLANELSDENLEVYVKEWGTESGEMDLPDEEKEWLQTYEQQWNDALDSVNDGNQLSQDAWADVIDEIPENTERITEFADFLREQHQQMGQADKWQDQVILLSLWEQFNQLVVQ